MKPKNIADLYWRGVNEQPAESNVYLIVLAEDNEPGLRSDRPIEAYFKGDDWCIYDTWMESFIEITDDVVKWMPFPNKDEAFEGQADLLISATEELLSQVVNMAVHLSQEVQEFIDAAEECGTDLQGSKALLGDWNQLYQQVREFE